MSDNADAGGSEITEEQRSRLKALLDKSEIVNIRTASFSARLHGEVPREPITAILSIEAGYHCAQGEMANRFAYKVDLEDTAETAVATIEFVIIVDYRVDPEFDPDKETVDLLCSTTGHFAAYPYARELVQSLSSRLQIAPIITGFIRRGTTMPRAISAVGQTKAYATAISGVAEEPSELGAEEQ